ncbi:hypothetical protein VH571_15035 [Frondihabitans sp. 4ASC-45]|uniref:hypothetical protein n=1 Tax=Frondihabitans sp. 4ASC-45 TaxID=3111636 RepID=UPI003C169493
MTRYQLAWDDSRTGRLWAAEDESLRPMAWLRVTWGEGHKVARVDVYGDGPQASDRQWLAESTFIREAVEFCDAKAAELRPGQSSEPMPAELGEPWDHHSVVDVA